jgi:hypothetical protein
LKVGASNLFVIFILIAKSVNSYLSPYFASNCPYQYSEYLSLR